MKKNIFLLTLVCFSITAFSYPISPRPLRKLIIESEYIIWGKVIQVGETKPSKNYDPWDRDYALIVVTEKLQGKLNNDTVQVFFCNGMICPAPGTFSEGETVLTFLDKRKKETGYEVHALSYGVKHGLTETGYQLYKQRIQEMQELITNNQASICSPAIIDWLMKCAESRATRWDGLYEINPQSDFMSFYQRGELACKDSHITTEHRKKLFDILIAIDTLSYSDMALVDITEGTNDAIILSFLKKQLTMVDSEDGYYFMANAIMVPIVRLVKNKELEDLQKEFDNIHYNSDEKSKATTKRIYKQFIEKMQSCELKKTISASGNDNAFVPAGFSSVSV